MDGSAAPIASSAAEAEWDGTTTKRVGEVDVTAAFTSLPTLGFKASGRVEPILPLIFSGDKSIELRRTGSKLSDGRTVDTLAPGDRFLGLPLSRQLTYLCVVEVTAPVEFFPSHGAAWTAHGDSALPRSLGRLQTAAAAQRYIEKTFYNGRVLANAPVVAVPVRAIAWLD